MNNTDELRYVQAFARIIGVKEDDALEYAQRKGIGALVENATQLLSTPAQREKASGLSGSLPDEQQYQHEKPGHQFTGYGSGLFSLGDGSGP